MTAWTSPLGLPTDAERETVATLLAIIGGSEAQAGEVLDVLRKNGGNAERAADALLGNSLTSSSSSYSHGIGSSSTSMAIVPYARPNTPVGNHAMVDLTKDDDMDIDNDEEMKRALAMSMGDSMSIDQTDFVQDLTKAKKKEPENLEEMRRKKGRPIALHTNDSANAYIGMLLQALFHVPQVRARFAEFQIDPTTDFESIDHKIIYRVMELFTNLDLANLAKIDYVNAMDALEPLIPVSNQTPLVESTKELCERLANILEDAVCVEGRAPLFTFTSAQVDVRAEYNTEDILNTAQSPLVALDISSTSSEPNDLLDRLARNLYKPSQSVSDVQGGSYNLISHPSEVFIFILTNNSISGSTQTAPGTLSVPLHTSSNSSSSSKPFTYPSLIHIDPFLLSNISLMHNKRQEGENLQHVVRECEEAKERLLGWKYVPKSASGLSPNNSKSDKAQNHENAGILPSLRAALHYYTHVASQSDNVEMEGNIRKQEVEVAERNLKATIEGLEKVLKELDAKINSTKTEIRALFEDEELKKYQYDLRAVLMRPLAKPRLLTRNFIKLKILGSDVRKRLKTQLFAYVRNGRDGGNSGKKNTDNETISRWWKIDVNTAEQVSAEAVFSNSNDTIPYMLIYSKSLSHSISSTAKLKWPAQFIDDVEERNAVFLEELEHLRNKKAQEQDARMDV
ncbi:hypothetical protein BDP27DRAFT_1356471 [Rhodocollybia butyracea]|uniref:UBA domain-containing protein n=1 Tax=Rhodocollybia butyracea TaxID=206335 RepID=A0A9P5QAK0_9AGAR|nr:hypothetical protein BDP27DRAFT_1356471 [Rhodocollybia butyracea]